MGRGLDHLSACFRSGHSFCISVAVAHRGTIYFQTCIHGIRHPKQNTPKRKGCRSSDGSKIMEVFWASAENIHEPGGFTFSGARFAEAPWRGDLVFLRSGAQFCVESRRRRAGPKKGGGSLARRTSQGSAFNTGASCVAAWTGSVTMHLPSAKLLWLASWIGVVTTHARVRSMNTRVETARAWRSPETTVCDSHESVRVRKVIVSVVPEILPASSQRVVS